jgi:hypothetical protein
MPNSQYKTVEEWAKNLGFDIHRVPGKYYVVCDWYMGNECTRMFDDNPLGDDEALQWMKEQKGVETRED